MYIYISHFCLHQACLASRKKKNREIQRERERERERQKNMNTFYDRYVNSRLKVINLFQKELKCYYKLINLKPTPNSKAHFRWHILSSPLGHLKVWNYLIFKKNILSNMTFQLIQLPFYSPRFCWLLLNLKLMFTFKVSRKKWEGSE